jgi:hypothetical protein
MLVTVARSKANPTVPYMTQAMAVQLHPIHTRLARAIGNARRYSIHPTRPASVEAGMS